MKKIFVLFHIALLVIFLQARAQELVKPLKLNVKYELNPLGDAHIEAGTTMDAAQWDNYKKMLGNNPDILKRQMERAFPGYFLQNFNYKEEVMNRSYILSFDALGLSKTNTKGLWQVDLNSKNPDITKLSDHNYVLTSNYASQNSLIQEIDNISFPAGAADIKQDKDAFGKAMFLYSFSPGGSASGWLVLALGIILMAVGAFLFVSSGSNKPGLAK